jgi:hypothetical protein
MKSNLFIAGRHDWRRGVVSLRRGSEASSLLQLWVLVHPGAWMSVVSVVYCQVCLCVGMITRPNESYRCGVSGYDREALIMKRPRFFGVVKPCGVNLCL